LSRPSGALDAGVPPLCTILLVEDEVRLREVLRMGLVALGFQVLEAGDGRQALEVLAATGQSVSIVVTDILMPGMDGLELASQLDQRFPGLPILVITGWPDPFCKWDGLPLPLLMKPFRLRELVGRIRHLLNGKLTGSQPGS